MNGTTIAKKGGSEGMMLLGMTSVRRGPANARILLPSAKKYACDDELIDRLFHISPLWMDRTNHNHSSGSPLQKSGIQPFPLLNL